MSPADLLNPIEKRNMLAAKDVSRETLVRHGNAFFEAEAFDDAYSFFEKAGDAEGVRRVKQSVIDLGLTAVLLFWIQRSKLVQVTREDWVAVAQNALKLGKLSYAAQAFRKLGDTEKLNELLPQIPGQRLVEPPEPEKTEE